VLTTKKQLLERKVIVFVDIVFVAVVVVVFVVVFVDVVDEEDTVTDFRLHRRCGPRSYGARGHAPRRGRCGSHRRSAQPNNKLN
jgi:hypothetical protein